ncbi:hypothetical protein [Arthrobacter sp. Br18]|uniref:hypothetical protein n=1 Tax=Arthrobacter sp. Br18 TaxID=1312954 RepID=UPI0004791FB9|nr:hypothetical protein [Arthrobacter sp. Br18]
MTSATNSNPAGEDSSPDSSDVQAIQQDDSLTQADQMDYLANQAVPDDTPTIETVAGHLNLEDSPSDHPSGDQLRGR